MEFIINQCKDNSYAIMQWIQESLPDVLKNNYSSSFADYCLNFISPYSNLGKKVYLGYNNIADKTKSQIVIRSGDWIEEFHVQSAEIAIKPFLEHFLIPNGYQPISCFVNIMSQTCDLLNIKGNFSLLHESFLDLFDHLNASSPLFIDVNEFISKISATSLNITRNIGEYILNDSKILPTEEHYDYYDMDELFDQKELLSKSFDKDLIFAYEKCQRDAFDISQWFFSILPDIIKRDYNMSLKDYCYHLADAEENHGEVTIGYSSQRALYGKISIGSGSLHDAWHDHLTQIIYEPFIQHAKFLERPFINCYTNIASQICDLTFNITSRNTDINTMPKEFEKLFNDYATKKPDSYFDISDLVSNFSKSINFAFHNSTKIFNASSGFIHDNSDYIEYEYNYDGRNLQEKCAALFSNLTASSSDTNLIKSTDPSDYIFNPGSFVLGVMAALSGILIYNCVSKKTWYQNFESKVKAMYAGIGESICCSETGLQSDSAYELVNVTDSLSTITTETADL
jgi:hypothetical protein